MSGSYPTSVTLGRFLYIFVFLLISGVIPSASQSRREEDGNHSAALERLSRVFGIDRLPHLSHHRTPPQYMTDLYDTVAYSNGVTKTSTPFDANVVRGLPDRASQHQMHFYFNVSNIKPSEKILEAEFHLFKLRPGPTDSGRSIPRGVNLIELKLYQVLEQSALTSSSSPTSESGLRQLDHRRISPYKHGWEVFSVGIAVNAWANGSNPNLGFLVTAKSTRGQRLPESYIRFAQRSQHHDSKQPVLVVFTEDPQTKAPTYEAPAQSEIVLQADMTPEHLERLQQRQRQVAFLNEGYTAPQTSSGNNNNALRSRHTPRYLTHIEQVHNLNITSNSRTRTRRSAHEYRYPRRRKPNCSKHEMYVDFDEIGWSGWIISPKGYNAYHCKGQCPFPLGQNQKPTNHATVQSIVQALRISKDIGTPCCVPNKLYSISLLYFDDDENVILKQYDDMVAASCGCH